MWQILQHVILPLFIIIGLGIVLKRRFKLEMQTLSKLLFNCFIPAIIFVNLYKSELPFTLILEIVGYLIVMLICLILLGLAIVKLLKLPAPFAANVKNGVVLSNSGNYGLPVNDLVFKGDPLAMTVQIIVMTFMNLLTFTYGLFNVNARNQSGWQALLGYLKSPICFALVLGVCFNALQIDIPQYIWLPLQNVANAMIAVALITLGAQVAYLKLNRIPLAVGITIFARLCIAPLIALGVILLLSLDGIIAQVLLISSAFPSSRNSAAIALEYNNEPEFAAQIVLFSTLLSVLTITFIIYLAQLLF